MNHLLVFTDFSGVTSLALDQALAIATGSRAKITVCHIRSGENGDSEEDLKRNMDEYLSKFKNHDTQVETCICTGDLYEQATNTAKRLNPDLVVTGTRGSAGIGLKTLGSAIHKLVRGLPVPSLVLGKECEVMKDGYGKVLIPAGDQDSFIQGVDMALNLLAENGEVVLYAIVSKGKPLSKESLQNMDQAKKLLKKKNIAWRYEEEKATPYSIGFAAQTLEYMRSNKMEMVVIPAEVSNRNKHFGKLDKEAVLLNEDGFHVLCTVG